MANAARSVNMGQVIARTDEESAPAPGQTDGDDHAELREKVRQANVRSETNAVLKGGL
jgi:hypothetical protein